jgi:hypothetical protein
MVGMLFLSSFLHCKIVHSSSVHLTRVAAWKGPLLGIGVLRHWYVPFSHPRNDCMDNHSQPCGDTEASSKTNKISLVQTDLVLVGLAQ